jgi:hypothetical protein
MRPPGLDDAEEVGEGPRRLDPGRGRPRRGGPVDSVVDADVLQVERQTTSSNQSFANDDRDVRMNRQRVMLDSWVLFDGDALKDREDRQPTGYRRASSSLYRSSVAPDMLNGAPKFSDGLDVVGHPKSETNILCRIAWDLISDKCRLLTLLLSSRLSLGGLTP